MQELITIKTFNTHADLGVVRSYLEAAGIRCFVADEYINTVNPFYTNASGGIKLQVAEDDAPEAARLLVEGGFATPEDFDPPREMVAVGRALERIKKAFGKK